MNNYTSQAAQASDALKKMAQIMDRIAEDAPDVEICAVAYGVITRESEIHIYCGINDIAELYGCPIKQSTRTDSEYPIQKEIIIDGVTLFELASERKGNL